MQTHRSSLVLLVACLSWVSCSVRSPSRGNDGGQAGSGLVGPVAEAPGFDNVTVMFNDDGTFTWNNRTQAATSAGTWKAESRTLTFSYAKDQPFCGGGPSRGSTNFRATG
jgi:hypothetical protein